MGGEPFDDAQIVARARVGKLLRGKLRLDQLLGVGGTAAVYAATHRTGKRYAVKVIHPHLMLDGRIRERFFREGYVVNRIAHPGVVAIVDDDIDDGLLFLVMELLEGEDIASFAERRGGSLSAGDLLFIVDRALDVLAVAHEQGIIHRDFKPANVFWTTGGAIKVLDFGIARLRELGKTPMTQSGTVMGTAAFMPPEQARGRWTEVDARSDIWAVGATMFTLLTGRLVFEARTANEALLAAMTATAPPVRRIHATVPADVAEIIDRALEREPGARWPDARTMQAAVRDALQKHPPTALVKTETVPSSTAAAIELHESSAPRTIVDVAFQHTIQSPESAVDAFLRRGVSRQESDDIDGAIEDYSKALELDPGCVGAYQNRGALLHGRGECADALADYRAALDLRPQDPDLLFNSALAMQSLGDLAGARRAAEAAAQSHGRSSSEKAEQLARAQALVTMLSGS